MDDVAVPSTTQKPRYVWIGIIVLVCTLGLAYYLGYTKGQTTIPSEAQVRLNSPVYHFINPLLDESEASMNSLMTREVNELKDRIEEITETKLDDGSITKGSVYARDLNNGPWFSTGEEFSYRPASLFKVPVMIAFFKEAETNPDILKKSVTYTERLDTKFVFTLDKPEYMLELGKTYTILELIERMIIYSDNEAALLLLQNIDFTRIEQVHYDFDIETYNSVTPSENFIGPREYAGFLRILYNSTYLNREYSEKALEIMSRTVFANGMRTVLPDTVPASTKFGIAYSNDGSVQLHECGVIYWNHAKPYVICIMTEGKTFEAAAAYIVEVMQTMQAHVRGEKD